MGCGAAVATRRIDGVGVTAQGMTALEGAELESRELRVGPTRVRRGAGGSDAPHVAGVSRDGILRIKAGEGA